jgi:uncharacterized SAM-binding protein YcdF (DUF218 family)
MVFVGDRLMPADVAIVFGMSAWRRPVARAVELYRDGLTRRLLFTGGFNARIGAVEALEMAKEALACGIPAADILVEDQATNTFENMAFSRALLGRAGACEAVTAVLLVAIHFHMRRVLMTAERTFPPPIILGTASYPSAYYTDRDWAVSRRGREDVASEIKKIALYLDADWPGALA